MQCSCIAAFFFFAEPVLKLPVLCNNNQELGIAAEWPHGNYIMPSLVSTSVQELLYVPDY
jgi:hypothetical protein